MPINYSGEWREERGERTSESGEWREESGKSAGL